MRIIKVNNFGKYLLLRTIITLILCFLTYNITGRIADAEALLGNNYNTTGIRTLIAKNIYGLFAGFNSLFLVIVIISFITSGLIYFLLRKYIDNSNVYYWYLLLICPGILLYTNTPTKETLFFFPAITLIILETNSLLNFRSWSFNQRIINQLNKFIILILLFRLRGVLCLPYIFFTLLIPFLRYFSFRYFNKRVNILKSLFTAFLISNIILIATIYFYPTYILTTLDTLKSSFTSTSSLSRGYLNSIFIFNPLNSINIQYLGLFPTINELINKPYALVIFFESALYIFLYHRVWKNLFKTVNKDVKFKIYLNYIFIIITIFYFTIFGYLSIFNIGSGQRFRINFIPLGIIFPLILENKIRTILIKRDK